MRRKQNRHRRRPPDRCGRALPYRRRGPLLSKGEAAFYRVLRLAIGGKYHVAFKVRLADLITCSDRDWQAGFGHLIARHHIDFVVCDYRTTEVLAAIELDDRSHEKASRRRRDAFVDEALAVSAIPLLRIQAASWYNPTALASAIVTCLEGNTTHASFAQTRARA